MSRSGYVDYGDEPELNLWRGAVERALHGKRGQAFLCDLLAALDAMPEKRLAAGVLVQDCECCAMGSVAMRRGVDVSEVDPYDRDCVAKLFGIAPAMAAEIAYVNDEGTVRCSESPEERFSRVRKWVCEQLHEVIDVAQP